MNSLPPEILMLVASKLANADVPNFRLVSRAFAHSDYIQVINPSTGHGLTAKYWLANATDLVFASCNHKPTNLSQLIMATTEITYLENMNSTLGSVYESNPWAFVNPIQNSSLIPMNATLSYWYNPEPPYYRLAPLYWSLGHDDVTIQGTMVLTRRNVPLAPTVDPVDPLKS